MLVGTSHVICASCGKPVPVVSGVCVLCGNEFTQEVIDKEVAEILEAA